MTYVHPNSIAWLPATGFPRLNPTDDAAVADHGLNFGGDIEIWKQLDHGTLFAVPDCGVSGYELRTLVTAHHDQSMRSFGSCVLIGLRRKDGSLEGEVPNRKLPVRVYK